ncbi:MAG TPA: dienelactone hydrolase family protein [Terracidiphilus sp.]|nr:dienelactone hydrolase family protein [Terracidiphilus sp.]
MRVRLVWLAAAGLWFARLCFGSVGFQEVTVPDPPGKPIAVGIWYPSSAQASAHPLGMFSQMVAPNGGIAGERLPLVLISHGAYGSMASHYDTAIALAEAGFAVAALTHTGDNSNDQTYLGTSFNLIDRPRQAKVVLDWMFSSWNGRGHLDERRVGVFGFSLGGFTALVVSGGTPELNRMALLCSTRPDAPECSFNNGRQVVEPKPVPARPNWAHDSRIRAVVVAAPAVSFDFGPGDLKHVGIPVQLWRAERDTQAPDGWNSAVVRKELPGPQEEHVVPGQDHYVFLAPCSAALAAAVPQICKDGPGFDRVAFHREFNRLVVNFLAKKLKGEH